MTDTTQYNINNQPILTADEIMGELIILKRYSENQRKAIDRMRSRLYDIEQDVLTLKLLIPDTMDEKPQWHTVPVSDTCEFVFNRPPAEFPDTVWKSLEQLCRQHRKR